MRPLPLSFLLTLLALGCGGGGASGTGGAGGAGTTSSSSSSSGAATTSSSSSSTSTSASSSSSATSASSSASSASSSTSGGDAGLPMGDCHADADCPGGACVPVTPGGFTVCQTPPVKATACSSPLDQCCAAMPCPGNAPCYAGPLVPVCSGAMMAPHNQCAVDQCTQDSDCADAQICAPAGTLGLSIRACLAAGCKVDADCDVSPGGACAPVEEPCCGTTAGLFCVYPSGGCRKNADCAATQYCAITGNAAACVTGGPLCPQ